MTKRVNKKLYNGDENIIFYPTSHQYKREVGGKRIDGVSSIARIAAPPNKINNLQRWAKNNVAEQITNYIEDSDNRRFSRQEMLEAVKDASKNWRKKLDEAANIGDQVHEWAEQFAQAQIDEAVEPPELPQDNDEVLKGVNAFLKWYNEHDIEFLETERIVYSKKHDYIGTADVVARIGNTKYATDYKTSKGVYPEHKLQLAGYRAAYNEEAEYVGFEPVEKSALLHFSKTDGDFKFIAPQDHDKDFDAFLSCLTLKRRFKQIK